MCAFIIIVIIIIVIIIAGSRGFCFLHEMTDPSHEILVGSIIFDGYVLPLTIDNLPPSRLKCW